MKCTIRIAKTKALISFAVTEKLICVFVFAYAKIRFSHDEAHCKQLLLPRHDFCPYSILITVFRCVDVFVPLNLKVH